jgi:hypothetical protein
LRKWDEAVKIEMQLILFMFGSVVLLTLGAAAFWLTGGRVAQEFIQFLAVGWAMTGPMFLLGLWLEVK